MIVRRVFLRWMFPAAFLLPLWLFVGWIVFAHGSGWALLWLLIAAPTVFVSQTLLTLLVRARGSVRVDGVASWRDVIGLGLWHVAIILLGFYDARSFFALLALSVVGALVLFWSSLAQLWNEARGSVTVLHAQDGTAYIPPTPRQASPGVVGDVIIVPESRPRD